LFATISGAHLYGFPSPESDFDLRGAHVLPIEKVVGLDASDETVEQEMIVPPDTSSGLRPPSPQSGEGAGALEMDIVSHDVRKFFGLLLKKNGYVLEQLFSPLVVHTTPEHAELKEICCPHLQPLSHPMGEGSAVSNTSPLTPLPGRGGEGNQTGVITKHHAHHYFGFAETQWKLFLKESPRRVKPLLYVYRVLLTGIHLMRTGEVQANLVTLNEEFRLPYIADLVARKLLARSNPHSTMPTSLFTKRNTSDCAANCRPRMRRVNCPNHRVTKPAKR
jgi:predicted nucleotidyltransferase